MNIKEQVKELIKAQDIIRQVYVSNKIPEKDVDLKQLDRHLSRIINLIGKI